MKVKAIKDVEYDNRRWKKGSVFELREKKGLKQNPETRKLEPHTFTIAEQFCASTMEALDGNIPVGKPAAAPKTRTPKTLAQAAKTDRTVVTDLDVI